MEHPKKSLAGGRDRLKLVEETFGSGAFDRIREEHRLSIASDDDILDAFAALWTADRILRGEARSLPEQPSLDSAELPMRMVY